MKYFAERWSIGYDIDEMPHVDYSYLNDQWTHDQSMQMDAALASAGGVPDRTRFVACTLFPLGRRTVMDEGIVVNGIHLSKRYEWDEFERLCAIGFKPVGRRHIGTGQGDGMLFGVAYEGSGFTVLSGWGSRYSVTRIGDERPLGHHEFRDLAGAIRMYADAGK